MDGGQMSGHIWIEHPSDPYPFHSMPTGTHIPQIQLFQNLTLEIQDQGHDWGQRSRSYNVSHIE